MTRMNCVRGWIATLAFVGALVGCGRVAMAPSTPSNSLLPAASQMQPSGAPVPGVVCPRQKGITAKPCVVRLTAKKATVTVTTGGPKGGKFTVRDTGCTTRLIATVKGKDNTYEVKAGSHGRGQCVVNFVDYGAGSKRLGTAKVIILNNVDATRKKP